MIRYAVKQSSSITHIRVIDDDCFTVDRLQLQAQLAGRLCIQMFAWTGTRLYLSDEFRESSAQIVISLERSDAMDSLCRQLIDRAHERVLCCYGGAHRFTQHADDRVDVSRSDHVQLSSESSTWRSMAIVSGSRVYHLAATQNVEQAYGIPTPHNAVGYM